MLIFPNWVGGRKRYNAQRQSAAWQRLLRVIALEREGWQVSQIAQELGVHRATVWRDLQRVRIGGDAGALALRLLWHGELSPAESACYLRKAKAKRKAAKKWLTS